MVENIKKIFYKKEQPRAIKRILRPKWLEGVRIRRGDDCFIIELWDTNVIVTIRDENKYCDTFSSSGNWDKKAINFLGESKIEYTARIDKLEVSQCFSISKPTLLYRITKDGNAKGDLLSKYEGYDDRGILISKRDNDDTVMLWSDIFIDEELVVNDMVVSMKEGPRDLIQKYGIPDVILEVHKSKSYLEEKSVNIKNISFMWGSNSTKYVIELYINVDAKWMIFGINIR